MEIYEEQILKKIREIQSFTKDPHFKGKINYGEIANFKALDIQITNLNREIMNLTQTFSNGINKSNKLIEPLFKERDNLIKEWKVKLEQGKQIVKVIEAEDKQKLQAEAALIIINEHFIKKINKIESITEFIESAILTGMLKAA